MSDRSSSPTSEPRLTSLEMPTPSSEDASSENHTSTFPGSTDSDIIVEDVIVEDDCSSSDSCLFTLQELSVPLDSDRASQAPLSKADQGSHEPGSEDIGASEDTRAAPPKTRPDLDWRDIGTGSVLPLETIRAARKEYESNPHLTGNREDLNIHAEMKLDGRTKEPLGVFLVDTDFLLSNLDACECIVEKYEEHKHVFVIPRTVLLEIDLIRQGAYGVGPVEDQSTVLHACQAHRWIRNRLIFDSPGLWIQKEDEFFNGMENDGPLAVLSCAQFFQEMEAMKVLLLSRNRELCIHSLIRRIKVVRMTDECISSPRCLFESLFSHDHESKGFSIVEETSSLSVDTRSAMKAKLAKYFRKSSEVNKASLEHSEEVTRDVRPEDFPETPQNKADSPTLPRTPVVVFRRAPHPLVTISNKRHLDYMQSMPIGNANEENPHPAVCSDEKTNKNSDNEDSSSREDRAKQILRELLEDVELKIVATIAPLVYQRVSEQLVKNGVGNARPQPLHELTTIRALETFIFDNWSTLAYEILPGSLVNPGRKYQLHAYSNECDVWRRWAFSTDPDPGQMGQVMEVLMSGWRPTDDQVWLFIEDWMVVYIKVLYNKDQERDYKLSVQGFKHKVLDYRLLE